MGERREALMKAKEYGFEVGKVGIVAAELSVEKALGGVSPILLSIFFPVYPINYLFIFSFFTGFRPLTSSPPP
jgi:hypothetical protein